MSTFLNSYFTISVKSLCYKKKQNFDMNLICHGGERKLSLGL